MLIFVLSCYFKPIWSSLLFRLPIFKLIFVLVAISSPFGLDCYFECPFRLDCLFWLAISRPFQVDWYFKLRFQAHFELIGETIYHRPIKQEVAIPVSDLKWLRSKIEENYQTGTRNSTNSTWNGVRFRWQSKSNFQWLDVKSQRVIFGLRWNCNLRNHQIAN